MRTYLYELVVTVDKNGCRSRLDKYPVRKTGLNFIPEQVTAEDESNGCRGICMSHRVKIEDLMKPDSHSLGLNKVTRFMFCTEENIETAKRIMRDIIDVKVNELLATATAIHKNWTERPNKPVD